MTIEEDLTTVRPFSLVTKGDGPLLTASVRDKWLIKRWPTCLSQWKGTNGPGAPSEGQRSDLSPPPSGLRGRYQFPPGTFGPHTSGVAGTTLRSVKCFVQNSGGGFRTGTAVCKTRAWWTNFQVKAGPGARPPGGPRHCLLSCWSLGSLSQNVYKACPCFSPPRLFIKTSLCVPYLISSKTDAGFFSSFYLFINNRSSRPALVFSTEMIQ